MKWVKKGGFGLMWRLLIQADRNQQIVKVQEDTLLLPRSTAAMPRFNHHSNQTFSDMTYRGLANQTGIPLKYSCIDTTATSTNQLSGNTTNISNHYYV